MKFFKKLFSPTSVSFQVKVDQSDICFHSRKDKTVLESALEAGIAFPHDCRVGTCGTCKCILLDGQTKAVMDYSYALSAEELNQGYILACQAKAKSDLLLKIDGDLGQRRHDLSTNEGYVSRVLPLTHDIAEVQVKLESPIKYLAGQYADITTTEIGDGRSYSFAEPSSSEGSSLVKFFVRKVPGGLMSNLLNDKSAVQRKVILTGPYGDFFFRGTQKPVLFICGGSGFAPIKAILEQCIQDQEFPPVVFLFGARTEDDLYCLEEISEIQKEWKNNFEFVPLLSNEPLESSWSGARGLVTEYIDSFFDAGSSGSSAYLCGPPAMIDAAIEKLVQTGMKNDQIHFDKFLDKSHLQN